MAQRKHKFNLPRNSIDRNGGVAQINTQQGNDPVLHGWESGAGSFDDTQGSK